MPPFAECCVVIPCNTIEDFPSRLDSAEARSLLGGLTVAWHPHLIAASNRTPTWYRGDEMPPPIRAPKPEPDTAETAEFRLIIVPEASFSILPVQLSEAVTGRAFGVIEPSSPEFVAELVVRVASREDAIEQINAAIESLDSGHDGSIQWNVCSEGNDDTDGRSVDQNDFYALGYTWWQVQVLTRKLRYTSNLDQIHFENRVTDAANHLINGTVVSACEAIHDCFDALAEERDHYFSSDPSMIDLTLLTPGTISKWIDLNSHATTVNQPSASRLPTPQNVLVDEDAAFSLTEDTTGKAGLFRDLVSSEQMSWCGGGPSSEFRLETSSIDEIEQRVSDAMAIVGRITGELPSVYARLGGGVASQWLPAIVASDFKGIVPIDFINGRGYDNESKVILGEGANEIEALTAQPLDADDDASFLTLATRLGEAIDGGEIATALMAHWPGEGCDSFRDVRRAATWTLALGKFWKIDDYFIDGERPYHHGQSPTATSSAESTMSLIQAHQQSAALVRKLNHQTCLNLRGMLALIVPSSAMDTTLDSEVSDGNAGTLRRRIVESLGHRLDNAAIENSRACQSVAFIHAHHPATRQIVRLTGKVSKTAASVFCAISESGDTRVVADVPAWGFCVVGQASSDASQDTGPDAPNLVQKLGRWLRRSPGKLLDGYRLSNEFMEVSISPEHGGINGVYSGRGRGNRFSTRMVMTPESADTPVTSVCEGIKTIEDSRISAVVELHGYFQEASRDSTESDQAAGRIHWKARYRLDRGSRRLQFRVQVTPPQNGLPEELTRLPSAWKHLPSLRVAIAEATPIIRSLVSERMQRTSAKTFSSSMGFVVEESEDRTTLVASDLATQHRRVQDRFIDSLILPSTELPDEHGQWQSFEFGFDSPNPIASAKTFIERIQCESSEAELTTGKTNADSQPWGSSLAVPLLTSDNRGNSPEGFAQQGWLMHVAPTSLDVQVVDVGVVSDEGEHLAIHFRVIQTAGRSAKAALRFCRGVHAAIEVSAASRPLARPALTGQLSELESHAISQAITAAEDRVSWVQTAHAVVHLVILFETGKAE